MGIEPMTSSLPRKRSTPELLRPNKKRAGNETRTRDPNLGRVVLYQLSYSRNLNILWGEEDSNLRRHTPADLQSAPFGHFGISPRIYMIKKIKRANGRTRTADRLITNQLLYQLSYIGL